MQLLNRNLLSIVLSISTLLGVVSHGLQAESLVAEVSASEHRKDLLSVGRHTHVESSTYAGSTHDLRAQTPATRPRDEDDKNLAVKKRIGGEGFGDTFSSSTSL